MAKKKEISTLKNEYSIIRVPEMRRALLDAWTYTNGDTKEQLFLAAIKLSSGKCFYCGEELAEVDEDDNITYFDSIQWDHLYPSSLGNPLVIGNCVIACPGCNGAKSDSLPLTYVLEKLEKDEDTLYTLPEYEEIISDYSRLYKKKYPFFRKYSKQMALSLVSENEYIDFWSTVLRETLQSDWNKQVNWNGKLWKRHTDSELFAKYVESFSITNSARSRANFIVNVFSKDETPIKDRDPENIVKTLDSIYDKFQNLPQNLKGGIRPAIISFVSLFKLKDYYIKNSSHDVIDKIEAHVDKKFFKKLRKDFFHEYEKSGKTESSRIENALQQSFSSFTQPFKKSLDKTIHQYSVPEMTQLILQLACKKRLQYKRFLILRLLKELNKEELNYNLFTKLIDSNAAWVDEILPKYSAFVDLGKDNPIISSTNSRELRLKYKVNPATLSREENIAILRAYYKTSSTTEKRKLSLIREFSRNLGFNASLILLSVNNNLSQAWIDASDIYSAEDEIIYRIINKKYSVSTSLIFSVKRFVFTKTTGNTLKEVSAYQFQKLREATSSSDRSKIDYIEHLVKLLIENNLNEELSLFD